MINIKLNYEEALLLREVLEEYLSDLRMEITDTHDKNFREDLKKKEVFLKNVMNELKESSVQEPVI